MASVTIPPPVRHFWRAVQGAIRSDVPQPMRVFVNRRAHELLRLVQQLNAFRNHPNARQGESKVKFITQWLTSHGLRHVTVVPGPNFDPAKKANKGNKWLNIEVVVGDDPYDPATPQGMLIAHSDTIAMDEQVVKYTYDGGNLHHPWILDDTMQLAMAMYAAVDLQRWIKKHTMKGRFIVLITDGEEVNTLGMRGWLHNRLSNQELYPVDFMVVSEATGKTATEASKHYRLPSGRKLPDAHIPIIATKNKGKATYNIFVKQTNGSKLVDFMAYTLARLKIAQCEAVVQSQDAEDDGTIATRTTMPATIMSFTRTQAQLFCETRTNKEVDTEASYRLLRHVFNQTSRQLAQRYSRFSSLFAVDLSQFVRTLIYDSQKNTLEISVKGINKKLHPGSYDPFNIYDALAAAMVLLGSMFDDELPIEEILIGDKAKPNSVPDKITIQFTSGQRVDVNRLTEKLLDDPLVNLDTFIQRGIALGKVCRVKIMKDKHVPARNPVTISAEKSWITKIAQKTLKNNIHDVYGVNATIQEGRFSAMDDSGPTSNAPLYKENHDIIWRHGEGAFRLGIGAFSLLHGDEYLAPDDVIIATVLYKDLLQNLFEEATKQRKEA